MEVQIVSLTKEEMKDLLKEAARQGAEIAMGKRSKQWMSQKQAAEYLGISVYALRDRHYSHNLPVYRDRKLVRYLKKDLDDMMQGKKW